MDPIIDYFYHECPRCPHWWQCQELMLSGAAQCACSLTNLNALTKKVGTTTVLSIVTRNPAHHQVACQVCGTLGENEATHSLPLWRIEPGSSQLPLRRFHKLQCH